MSFWQYVPLRTSPFRPTIPQLQLRSPQILPQSPTTDTSLHWPRDHGVGGAGTATLGQGGGGLWTQTYGEGQGRSQGSATAGQEGGLNIWRTRAAEVMMSGQAAELSWGRGFDAGSRRSGGHGGCALQKVVHFQGPGWVSCDSHGTEEVCESCKMLV